VIGALVALALVVALLGSAESSDGETVSSDYVAVPLPTPEPTPTPEPIDLSQFGTERPEGLIGGLLYDILVGAGTDPQQAVCTAETLATQFTDEELIASGLGDFGDEALVPVIDAAHECGIDDETLEAAIALARGE
jgi:hypothetical protein